MSRRGARRARDAGPAARSAFCAASVEALTVAMALAPGVYSRNRMFSFFADAGVLTARARAATLRGIVKHLGRAENITLTDVDPTLERVPPASASTGPDLVVVEGGAASPPTHVLRYEIPSMRLARAVELTSAELSALRMLAARASLPCLPLDAGDRARVEHAILRLLRLGGDVGDLALAAKDTA